MTTDHVPCANCRKPCPPYAGDAGTLCRDCLIALRERLADEHMRQAASGTGSGMTMAEKKGCAVCGSDGYMYFPQFHGLAFCRAHAPGLPEDESHMLFLKRMAAGTEAAHYAFFGLTVEKAKAIAAHIESLEHQVATRDRQIADVIEQRNTAQSAMHNIAAERDRLKDALRLKSCNHEWQVDQENRFIDRCRLCGTTVLR